MSLCLPSFHGATALVCLRALERGDERVGQHGRVLLPVPAMVEGVGVEHDGGSRTGCGEAVERDVEAKLECLALQRVGVGTEAGGAEEPRRREHGAGDVERGHLSVAAPPGQGHGLPHHGRRLRGQCLLHRAAAGTHPALAYLLLLLALLRCPSSATNGIREQRAGAGAWLDWILLLATCDVIPF